MIQLFVEGGGDTRELQRRVREAFHKLFESARLTGRLPRVIAAGGRTNAIRGFMHAIDQGFEAVLLVDSEGPVEGDNAAAATLQERMAVSEA